MRKAVLVGAAVLVAGVAAVAAQDHRGRMGRGHGHGMGPMGDMGFGPMGSGPMGGMRGMRGGPGMGLKALDTDKDGAVTLAEFLVPHETRFGEHDTNKDGSIDAAEAGARSKASVDYWMKVVMRRLDADRDGKVTKEEFRKRARDGFAMRDLDGDGQITDADLPPGMKGRMDAWRKHRDATAPDGKGSGDGKGPPDGKGPRSGLGGPFNLDRILGRSDAEFARLDRNSDGVIDAKDLDVIAAERTEYWVKRFMHRYDQNKDGKASKDEFLRFARERFAMIDLDGDGKITEADLPPMMRGRGILK
ncbi:MAG TPA: EF-hand domain-containing protein [Hyphomicrobiaceae bacterium]|nr:EF-hand domain-containing protein [Hyphomicrobiaceae bacterium]